MKTVFLDCGEMLDRESAHTLLKEKLSLPEWYGNNLDALYDCMCELEPCIIVMERTLFLASLGGYGLSLLDVMRAAAAENPNITLVEERQNKEDH